MTPPPATPPPAGPLPPTPPGYWGGLLVHGLVWLALLLNVPMVSADVPLLAPKSAVVVPLLAGKSDEGCCQPPPELLDILSASVDDINCAAADKFVDDGSL